MLLVNITINAVLNYVSQEGIALTNNWKPKVMSIDPIRYQIQSDYGGYCALNYGSISFFPDLFEDDWPPPVECAISVYYTATTEAAKETVFTGTAYLEKITREGVTYGLYGPKFTATVAHATGYNDTLDAHFATWCGAGLLNLTLDTTYSRAVSPNVTHTTSGTQLCIDLASKVAAFYNHMFYISGTTLYLIDMQIDGGSGTYTEFQYFPSRYEYLPPVSIASSGGRARTSSYPYGKELSVSAYHDTGANIDDCLDDIITSLNAPRASLSVPLVGSLPTPGKKISWTDTAQGADTDMWIRVRNLAFDFDKEEVILEGDGVIAAA